MRILMKVVMPNEPFNSYVRDGSINLRVKKILDNVAPEAVYFTTFEGKRTMLLIVNIDDSARIPSLAEPFFLVFEAEVELSGAMNLADLKKAKLEELGKLWG